MTEWEDDEGALVPTADDRVRAGAVVPWAREMAGDDRSSPLREAVSLILDRFGEGATLPEELPELAKFRDALAAEMPLEGVLAGLRSLSEAGFLRGAVVVLAESLLRHPRPSVALAVASELLDALDETAGLAMVQAVLALDTVAGDRRRPDGPWLAANELLAETLEARGDVPGALRHYEAVLSVNVDHRRALRGWTRSVRELERRGLSTQARTRGLALLDGLEELELSGGLGVERYELGRPLGRGRHAVVYEAFDRHVGRRVAIKRLLSDRARSDATPSRLIARRFFREAETLAGVRSPYVVGLLDVQVLHRFIALELCAGGNLRLALRRGLISPGDMARIGQQLRRALQAVHAAGAIHRDIKPANILVRERKEASPIALGDFGLAIADTTPGQKNAGTLRYLAPEIRGGAKATPASDWFSAGVVLLELALAPRPLPAEFDRVDPNLSVQSFTPEHLDPEWTQRLQRLLSPDPKERSW